MAVAPPLPPLAGLTGPVTTQSEYLNKVSRTFALRHFTADSQSEQRMRAQTYVLRESSLRRFQVGQTGMYSLSKNKKYDMQYE